MNRRKGRRYLATVFFTTILLLNYFHSSAVASANTLEQSNERTAVYVAPPIETPDTKPVEVKVLSRHEFRTTEFTPLPKKVNLPEGPWAMVLLKWEARGVGGSQFDRFYAVFVDGVEIFRGSTPQQRAWTVYKEVTVYSSLLSGEKAFEIMLPNWVIPADGLTGYYVVDLTLYFYPPALGEGGAEIPALIIPATPKPSPPSFATPPLLHHVAGRSSTEVFIPEDAKRVLLQVYATGHALDEVWYFFPGPKVGPFETRPVRYLNVYMNDKLAASVLPFPYVYTGGWNPYLWRVIPGVNTFNIPPYTFDITALAGEVKGRAVLSLNLTNGLPRWFVSIALLVYRGADKSETLSYKVIADNTTLSSSTILETKLLSLRSERVIALEGRVQAGGEVRTVKTVVKHLYDYTYTRLDQALFQIMEVNGTKLQVASMVMIKASGMTEIMTEEESKVGIDRFLSQRGDVTSFSFELYLDSTTEIPVRDTPTFVRYSRVAQLLEVTSRDKASRIGDAMVEPLKDVRVHFRDSVEASGFFSAELEITDGVTIARVFNGYGLAKEKLLFEKEGMAKKDGEVKREHLVYSRSLEAENDRLVSDIVKEVRRK